MKSRSLMILGLTVLISTGAGLVWAAADTTTAAPATPAPGAAAPAPAQPAMAPPAGHAGHDMGHKMGQPPQPAQPGHAGHAGMTPGQPPAMAPMKGMKGEMPECCKMMMEKAKAEGGGKMGMMGGKMGMMGGKMEGMKEGMKEGSCCPKEMGMGRGQMGMGLGGPPECGQMSAMLHQMLEAASPGMRMGHRGPAGMLDLPLGRLNLTPEQRDKLRNVIFENLDKMQDMSAHYRKLHLRATFLTENPQSKPEEIVKLYAEMGETRGRMLIQGRMYRQAVMGLLTEQQKQMVEGEEPPAQAPPAGAPPAAAHH
ncbi:MAG: hypothetical protein KQJ78_06930 [Deltaproteobacteria bacterium]|nr:hypothetical protein [Deltaproteobacteria bacterium]